MNEKVSQRVATSADLEAINAVIEAAIMNWDLPERIKRLALPVYRYTETDFEHLEMIVAETVDKNIVGVAACEMADVSEVPGKLALLLHGLYVIPEVQHQGIGSQLFVAVEALVPAHGCDGLLVKAQTDAVGFFESQGMQQLENINPVSNYAYRFWKPINKA